LAAADVGAKAGPLGAWRAVSQATISTATTVAMITMVTRHGASVREKNSRISVSVLWRVSFEVTEES
jgi:hypothetical protein